jgi:hypothetical protein
MEDQETTLKQNKIDIRDEKNKIQKILEKMENQNQQLEKAKKEKEDEENKRMTTNKKQKTTISNTPEE